MSRVLLDTHAFLWFVFGDQRLSDHAASVIENGEVSKFLSVASLWEIAIKAQLGKLELGVSLEDFFRGNVTERELVLVSIELPHLLMYGQLPLHHRDPFDRLLVAQAMTMGVALVTADSRLAKYDVRLLW